MVRLKKQNTKENGGTRMGNPWKSSSNMDMRIWNGSLACLQRIVLSLSTGQWKNMLIQVWTISMVSFPRKALSLDTNVFLGYSLSVLAAQGAARLFFLVGGFPDDKLVYRWHIFWQARMWGSAMIAGSFWSHVKTAFKKDWGRRAEAE